MKKIIVVEGLDGVGKSTFISVFREELLKKGLTSFVVGRVKGVKEGISKFDQVLIQRNSEVSYIINKTIMSMLKMLFQSSTFSDIVIFDRFHLTEFVYSTVYRKRNDFDKFKETDDELSKLQALIIYLYADEEVRIKRINKEDDYSKEKNNEVRKMFDFGLKKSECKIVKINNSNDANNMNFSVYSLINDVILGNKCFV